MKSRRVRMLGAMLAIGLLSAACGNPTPTPAPSPDTEAIVNAYFRSLEAQDCAAGRALSVGLEASCDWRYSVDSHSIEPLASAIAPAATRIQYYVHATLTDPVVGQFRTGFFVEVVRQPDGTWKVTSVGTGP